MNKIIFLIILSVSVFVGCSDWEEERESEIITERPPKEPNGEEVTETTTEETPKKSDEGVDTEGSSPGSNSGPDTEERSKNSKSIDELEEGGGDTPKKPDEDEESSPGSNSGPDTKERSKDSKSIDESGHERTPRRLIIESIFEKETVDQETFVSHVQAGDEIIIQLSGLQKTRQFSDIYEKTVTSTWQLTGCSDYEDDADFLCEDNPTQYGDCTLSYRDYVGETHSRIEFDKKPENIPLQFVIGGKSYRMDWVTLHKGDFIRGVFQIKERMLEAGDKLYIRPMNDYKEKVKVGFLGYGYCEGEFEKAFKIMESTTFKMVPNDVKIELRVDLSIIKSGGG